MPSSKVINTNLIKLFSFKTKSGQVKDINAYYRQNWNELKTGNKTLNSIFEQIDDGDGVIQVKELNILNKVLYYIDNLSKDTKNNNVIEQEELQRFEELQKQNLIDIETISKMEFDTGVNNWSEGLDRNIKTIQLASDTLNSTYAAELERIGKEQGFTVEEVSSSTQWIEDSSIRRHDGKIYVSNHSTSEDDMRDLPEGYFTSERGNVNAVGQGNTLEYGDGFDLKLNLNEKHYGTSYLEGGNVLNTCLADGTPAAIVGEGSIGMTLELMDLDKNKLENVELVKKAIAEDLGLSVEQVTFIPQHEFHIDMIYRPLQNGKVAIPDYEEGLRLLDTLYNQYKAEYESTNSEAIKTQLTNIKEKINKLTQVALNTQSIREEANDYLTEGGYELVKIPCFTTAKDDATNFMNGVGGTSEKTGQKFYITNKSEYPELQNMIEEYLKNAGIDKVYFVSTIDRLKNMGGIDCLTQEK